MSKNPEDKKWVTKGAVKKVLGAYALIANEEAIDKLPAEPIKSPAQIERAIEYLEREADRLKEAGPAVGMLSYWAVAELCRLIIGQKQKEEFWDEEKIFGKS